MERKLEKLFDYQRFEHNERLEKLIREAENSMEELPDDSLSLISAAGEPETNGGDKATQEQVKWLREKITLFYGSVPQDIREKILYTFAYSGKEAARALAERLTKDHPQYQGIVELLK